MAALFPAPVSHDSMLIPLNGVQTFLPPHWYTWSGRSAHWAVHKELARHPGSYLLVIGATGQVFFVIRRRHHADQMGYLGPLIEPTKKFGAAPLLVSKYRYPNVPIHYVGTVMGKDYGPTGKGGWSPSDEVLLRALAFGGNTAGFADLHERRRYRLAEQVAYAEYLAENAPI